MAITTTNQLLPEIVVPLDAEERKFNLQFDLSSARESDPPKELEVIPEDCGSSDAMSREIVQLLNEQIGILSLSRVRDSLLMWSLSMSRLFDGVGINLFDGVPGTGSGVL
jgi:hypothetical protein